jgi:SAM-dependent methyltransferase
MDQPDAVPQFDRQYAAAQLQRSRQPLRQLVKGWYLRQVLAHVDGPTIDFGCGAGQLLRRLPAGSVGLEVNPYLVETLRAEGLDVRPAQGDLGDFDLPGLAAGRYLTLTISHVLEHLPDPAAALQRLLAACARLGVRRVIAVVPGAKGYASDRTHLTFIDRNYVDRHLPRRSEGFERVSLSYFPGPWEAVGRIYTFHEMMLVYHRTGAA